MPDLYQIAQEHLTSVALAVQRQDALDLDPVSTLATGIVEALKRSDQLLVQAMSGPAGSPLITNLVNVGIVATKVGAGLGYHGKELERLTFAALLHDIGLFAVPQSVISKSSRLTQDERMLIEQHPDLGYEAIRKAGPQYEWLAQVVRQAHERWNGQGYPNKLKGRQISEFAQIIGVVDVFDALVSPRGYRRRYFPHEAVRELMVAERTAFPREVLKALVEQLSAYPLGTSVRLTTGEVGTVKHINTNYPLRPIVWIEDDPVLGQESRQLDLSLTPLVSIVQTLEPPDVARLSFSTIEKSPQPSAIVPAASDQFTSLLEGLDALASAIQGAVEAKTPGREQESTALLDERRWTVDSSAQDLTDPSFEKEVIGLFALEAHEWLAQIQAALRQLGEGTHETMRPKLYGILLHGITNLAKSASTVQFHAIAQMASNLLPILHDVGRQEPRAMTAALLSLQEGLDRINVAVRRLAGDQADDCFEQEGDSVGPVEDTQEISPALAMDDSAASLQLSPVATGPSSPPLLHALRDLQQARARSMQPARDVLEAVIHRAEQKSDHLDVTTVGQILTELDRLDDEFLHEVCRLVPIMSRTLEELRARGQMDFVAASQLDPIIQQIEVLHDMANHVQATMITMFLQGLRSFLMVAVYRKTSTLPQRLETVQGRIHALIPMAEQWVNIGRIERSAIGNILPV
ncbi:MAG: HD domain-containing phosphohydrolase [Nitrospirota bacterium]|nr:HD domain-containing phosphohydrolase [Nitrospirota bacterium]